MTDSEEKLESEESEPDAVDAADAAAADSEASDPASPVESSVTAEAEESTEGELSPDTVENEAADENIVDDDDFEDDFDDDFDDDDDDVGGDPIEDIADEPEEVFEKQWYILKVQVNRESSICDALNRRVKMHGLESHFGDVLVPTEDIKEFTKTGKQRIVKRKLYPGYIVVNMAINDDTWFIVRETPGIGDFTGSVGKPAPIGGAEIDKILKLSKPQEAEDGGKDEIKMRFPYKVGDRVRVNEGNFQSLEGDVDSIDESNGRITVNLNMFGRSTPVQLDHWQVEKI